MATEDKKNWRVHRRHCCLYHGCKYGDDDCPVVTGKVTQYYPCESCQSPIGTYVTTPEKMQRDVNEIFTKAFGRTPIHERVKDILKEATELSRYTDEKNLREEAGDLLASLLALMNEQGWEASTVLIECLNKIERRIDQYRSLGRKYTVALLGGAFNPVTRAHVDVAQYVLDNSGIFDEVWFTPCYKHMYNKELVDAEHRVNMCRLAAEVDSRIKVCTYEIDQRLAGETYHFVKTLLEEDFARNQHDFSLIVGMDNANSFHRWVNYALLEKMIRFVVVHRPGIEADPHVDWYRKSPHIYLPPTDRITETSSTHVRFVLGSSKRPMYGTELGLLKGHIDPKVFEYIRENHLYHRSKEL